MYRQTYGPMNALADILGAYWKKQRTEGAMDYVSKFNDTIDQDTAPKPIAAPAPTHNLNVTPQIANQIAPMQGFGSDGVQPASSGLAGAIEGIQPANGGPSILQDMQNYAALNPQTPTGQENQQSISQALQSQDDKSAQQQQYNDFAAAKQANPQWYVGNTYVGDDAKAKQAAQAQQLAAQQTKQQVQAKQYGAYAFNRDSGQQEFNRKFGMSGEMSEPLSYNDYVTKTKNLKITSMRDMINKYGVAAAKMAEPMIDEAISSKLNSVADAEDRENRLWLKRFLLNDKINTPKGMRKALWATVEYNKDAKKMGKPTIDTAMLGKMLDAGKVSITAKDTGGSINFYAVPKDGGTFNDGSYMKPILTQGKTLSPGQVVNAKQKQEQMQETARHNQATEANTRRGQYMSAARAASSRGSGGAKAPSAAYRKIADTLQYKQEAAISAIKSGDAADNDDDHSVEEYRKACTDALQSGQLDDDDKAAVQQQMNDVMDLYQNSL